MNKLRLSTIPPKHIIKIAILLLAFSAFCLSAWLRSLANAEMTQAKIQVQQQQSINDDAQAQALYLSEYLPQYFELREQGIIGNPKRLQWLESVQKGAHDHLIPNLSFILSSTEFASNLNSPDYNAEIEVKTTPMQMDFTVLHEGDFYRLIHKLKQQALGVFSVQECEMRRTEDSNRKLKDVVLSNELKGSCNLLWYSITDFTSQWEDLTL